MNCNEGFASALRDVQGDGDSKRLLWRSGASHRDALTQGNTFSKYCSIFTQAEELKFLITLNRSEAAKNALRKLFWSAAAWLGAVRPRSAAFCAKLASRIKAQAS
jgi:hypothetical protein